MARYIDATKLEELCDIMADKCDGIGKSIWNQFRTTVEWCPTADVVEQKWIPVSERLPEDLEEVNVTWVNHAPEQYYDFVKDKHFTGSAVYYNGSWYWYSSTCVDILAEYGRNEMDKIDDGIEVVAWMPLPEPWKGESDGT